MSFQVPPYALHYDDEAEIRDEFWNPGEGDQVIDIGARYGSYTIPALAAGATVVAVDYNWGMLEALKAAASLNGFDKLEALCLFMFDGTTDYPPELSAEIAEPCPPEGVVFSTLDEIAGNKVDWIKVDVEGAELHVLQGGIETLKRDHPMLLIEDHTRVYEWCRKSQIRRKMNRLLRGLGYKLRSVPYEAETGSPRDFTVAT